MLIDTHAHLYLKDFSEDIENVIHRASQNDVHWIILPDIDSETRDDMFAIATRFPNCLPCIGLHPNSVRDKFRQELDEVHTSLSKQKCIAIGEIGIDKYWDTTYLKEQLEVFETQLYLAKEYHLPVIIHQRKSFTEIFDIIEQSTFKGSIKGVFHCFSGQIDDAHRCIELGYLLGIGGVVTFRNSNLQEIVNKIPLEHIVLETDAPYLAPTPYRGKRNEPSYIPIIARYIANLKGTSIESVAQTTSTNAMKLFNMKLT